MPDLSEAREILLERKFAKLSLKAGSYGDISKTRLSCFNIFNICIVFVLSSLTATRDYHALSAILQSGFDSKELPGE